MHEFYKEKGDKYSADKTKEKGKPKKILVSSKGYSEYLEKYTNDNYTNYLNHKKNHNINHRQIENIFYNKKNKYKPNSTSTENYNREFESDIFNIKNSNYQKYMNLNKEKKKNNKSIEITNSRNIRVKGTLKWPANISWTQDSEALFKSNAKNEGKNKNMTAFDRNQVDSVKYLFEGIDDKKRMDGDKFKKINKKKSDLLTNNNKKLSFDNKEYSLSRA